VFESTVQTTDSYYSALLQPESEAAEVDHTSVTACNKQIDRQRAPIPSLRAGWGSAHCRSVNAVSSGRTTVWLTDAWQMHMDDWASLYSVCV